MYYFLCPASAEISSCVNKLYPHRIWTILGHSDWQHQETAQQLAAVFYTEKSEEVTYLLIDFKAIWW